MAASSNTYRNVNLKLSDEELQLESATPLFKNSITEVVTPSDYFFSTNEIGSHITNIAPIDVNLDGLKDIVAHYWSASWNSLGDLPDIYTNPVPNNLVIYLQAADGSFSIGNEEVFGSKQIDLGGGASRKQTIADFNQDGYPDIAYAMNREDGRRWVREDDLDTWANQTAVFISNGDGTYRVDLLDPPSYYHTIDSRITSEGYIDIVLDSRTGNVVDEAAVAFRYINDEAILIESYPFINGASASFGTTSDSNVPNQLITAVYRDGGQLTIRLYEESGGDWNFLHEYYFETDNEITQFTCDNCKEIEEYRVVRFNGVNRVEPAIWESCSLNSLPGGENVFIVQLSSILVPNKLTDEANYVENWEEPDNEFVAFSSETGELVHLLNFIDKQDSDIHSYRFECVDKTGDGYDDLIVSNYGYNHSVNFYKDLNKRGALTLYKNNQQGRLERVNPKIFPRPQSTYFPGNGSMRALYEDLNGDGIEDILYYSDDSRTWLDGRWQFIPVSFYIFWGENKMF